MNEQEVDNETKLAGSYLQTCNTCRARMMALGTLVLNKKTAREIVDFVLADWVHKKKTHTYQ